MSTVPVISEHIVVTPGTCGGKPRIAGNRITVQNIAIWHVHQGMTPEQIVSDYDGITLSDVFAALTYYHDHRDEIEAGIERDRRLSAELEASQPSLVTLAMERIKELRVASAGGVRRDH